MCQNSMYCDCHIIGKQQSLLNHFLAQGMLANNHEFLANYLPPSTSPKMTGQEYVALSPIGAVIYQDKDLEVVKQKARDYAHSSQSSVYIFRPVLEIAPKRDVVETSITLAK